MRLKSRGLWATLAGGLVTFVLFQNFQKATPDQKKVFQDFDRWAAEYESVSPAQKPALEKEGKLRAQERKAMMLKLLRENPQAAQDLALSNSARKKMPASVQQFLEKKIGGRGTLDVALTITENGAPGGSFRSLQYKGKTFSAFTYGKNSTKSHSENFAFQGVVLGNEIALHENPVRILRLDEVEDLKAEGKTIKKVCPVSGKDTSDDAEAKGGAAEIGEDVFVLCSGGHIDILAGQLAKEGEAVTGVTMPTRPLSWTTGIKKVLYIRVNYPDDLTEPQTLSAAQTMMESVNQFMLANSYGRLSFQTTVTPLLTLPKTKAEYAALEAASSNGGSYALLSDARAVAKSNGFDYLNYQLDATRFNGGPGGYAGMGYVGSRGVWLKSSAVGVSNHEFGHNIGAWHSNFWLTNDGTTIGSGSNQEYGDSFDTMGNSGSAGHFNAYWKSHFGWIPSANYLTATQTTGAPPTSFQVRLEAFDKTAPTAMPFALRIRAGKEYWLNFRQLFTSNTYLMNGVELHWAPWASSNSGTQLLDTTPGSAAGKTDSAITVGRTFIDENSGVSVRAIQVNATSPPSIDLQIDFSTVAPIVQSLSLSPTSLTMASSTQKQFTASASDQFGQPVPASSYVWSSSCGNVDASGLYTAPAVGATCDVFVSVGSVSSAPAKVTVYLPTVTKILLTPTSASLVIGKTLIFAASVRDQYNYVMSSAVSWSSGACGTVSSEGLFTATVSGNCAVTATSGSVSAAANVSVTLTASKGKGGGGGRK